MRGRGESRRARRERGARRWGSILLAGGVVVAVSAGVTVSTPTAAYSAAVRLIGTTIGVGPSFDGFGLSIPMFFYGSTVPEGDSFHTVPYPAQINVDIPIVSDLPGLSDIPYWPHSLKRSEQIGAGYLQQDIANTPADDKVTIIGMSQGTEVAEIVRAAMAKDPNYVANADNYEFVFIGDPYQPNGGILARFTSWSDVPVLGDLFPLGRPGPSDSPFKTTYYQNQYDGFADFPAYFNVLSIANAVAGILFQHVFPGYVLEHPDAANAVTTQVGNTTYVTLPQYLPLLAPLRIPASVIGAERFVDALDPVLRVFVEMGYDRTADPSQVKEFGWVTPPEKIHEALNELPAAFEQSLAILGGEKYTPTLPQPVVSGTEPETPVTDHPIDPVGTSPFEQGVRHTVEDVAVALSDATRPLAKVLQAIGGATAPHKTVDPADSPAPLVTKAGQDIKAGQDAKAGKVDTEAGSKIAADVPDAKVGNVADAKAGDEPKSTPLGRHPRTRTDSPRTDSAPRLKVVRDADTSDEKPARATKRATKPADKQAAKSANDHPDRPAKHESKQAG
ncbi:PE-PPE domain-containing protein [Mycolicibacterium porcinum]|uniref:PE-PPE domain-containing protein n=1 Tax=Mycolicibacterium porcinum TaxID=39693 RepID=UPI00080B0035|nr:PE-PPE domain-containing protein [Mycolicibacterium porcinum]OCB14128.1 PE-PPE domain-containing protein [Mycolicibacterium porcinum]